MLEYSSTIWDPYLKKDIKTIESIQQRAACFVQGDYRWEKNVMDMLESLGWKSLESRRRYARFALMYKVVRGLVAVSFKDHLELNVE